MTDSRTKLLSVVGPGRSGTTILASVMGEAAGVVTAGEIRRFWRRGVIEQRKCGCGKPPIDCEVWSKVLGSVLGTGGATQPDAVPKAQHVVRAQEVIALRRNRIRVIRSVGGAVDDWAPLAELRDEMDKVCTALAEVTGARLVIDTSKRAQDAAVVAGTGQFDHYVLHIVRDPRAVVHSWRRKKPNPALSDTGTMATSGLVSSVLRWTENCLSAELLRRHLPADRWMSLRYEDFAASPRATVDRIFGFVGLDAESPFADDDTVVLGGNHTVSGNPNRFRTGPVRITEDDEWSRVMTWADQARVGAITMPLLLRYGYPVRPLVGAS